MIFPAAYSDSILEVIKDITKHQSLILDPFSGSGRIHELPTDTIGLEIEYPWSTSVCGDATNMPFADKSIPCIVTSPTYGNRMSDHHSAKDGSYRRSYTHDIRRLTKNDEYQLHSNNTGYHRFNVRYRNLHRNAYREMVRVLTDNGLLVLNVSDHIRQFEIVKVSEWHLNICQALVVNKDDVPYQFQLIEEFQIETPRLKFGTHSELRVPYERLFVFRLKSLL
jgi:DNA modification methylase